MTITHYTHYPRPMSFLYNNKYLCLYYNILQIYTSPAYLNIIIIINCILDLSWNRWRELKSWYSDRQRISAINEYFILSGAYPIVSRTVGRWLFTNCNPYSVRRRLYYYAIFSDTFTSRHAIYLSRFLYTIFLFFWIDHIIFSKIIL